MLMDFGGMKKSIILKKYDIHNLVLQKLFINALKIQRYKNIFGFLVYLN